MNCFQTTHPLAACLNKLFSRIPGVRVISIDSDAFICQIGSRCHTVSRTGVVIPPDPDDVPHAVWLNGILQGLVRDNSGQPSLPFDQIGTPCPEPPSSSTAPSFSYLLCKSGRKTVLEDSVLVDPFSQPQSKESSQSQSELPKSHSQPQSEPHCTEYIQLGSMPYIP